MEFQQGKRDEDHLAAIMFNAMALIHYEEMIERGLLPAELNDMPNYQSAIDPSRVKIRKMRKGAKEIKNPRYKKPASQGGKPAVADSIVYPGLVHLNGCLMAAVDLETTGTRPGYHEIIQIAVVPLDSDFKPLGRRAAVLHARQAEAPGAGIGRGEAQAQDSDGGTLAPRPGVGPSGRLALRLVQGPEAALQEVPRAAGPQLGLRVELLEGMAGRRANRPDLPQPRPRRDALRHRLNDKAAFAGEPAPFPRVGLGAMCAKLGIVNTNPHDALADCIAEAEVYHALLRMF